jgi:hypothetical protein
MTKRMINVPVGTPALLSYKGRSAKVVFNNRVSIYPDGTDVEKLIKTLQEINDLLGKDYTNLSIESEFDCGCYNECRCSPSYYVWGTREETDLEYNFRLEEEDRRAREDLERDRKAYEELKKKFGE